LHLGGGLSESYENAIRDLLFNAKDSRRVADSLIKRLKAESSNLRERTAFVRFLINGGYFKEVLELYTVWFKEKRRLPLYEFCFLLNASGFKPSSDFLKNIFLGHKHLGEESNFTHFMAWEEHDSQLAEMRRRKLADFIAAEAERKKSLLDRLEYYRVNRMIEEEEKLLNELILYYPNDEGLKKQSQGFHERWARAVIARQTIQKFDLRYELPENTYSAEEMTFVKTVLSEMQNILQRQPHMAYDFALAFCFFEIYEPARLILAQAQSNYATDWLYAEILLKCRRFAEALDALLQIENKYADDAENSFGVVYARALALEGLGQTGAATELLKSLISIRPGYRSAHTLLLKWGGRL
jgi:tetratricopeptide (TPR) repeat protein